LRRAAVGALRDGFQTVRIATGVASHQLDVFLFEPGSDRYLGRLCGFGKCPKGTPECFVPGCGEVPFNKRVDGFEPHADLLAPAAYATLYQREMGIRCSALDLPAPSHLDPEKS
jgi:hypothetical protein